MLFVKKKKPFYYNFLKIFYANIKKEIEHIRNLRRGHFFNENLKKKQTISSKSNLFEFVV